MSSSFSYLLYFLVVWFSIYLFISLLISLFLLQMVLNSNFLKDFVFNYCLSNNHNPPSPSPSLMLIVTCPTKIWKLSLKHKGNWLLLNKDMLEVNSMREGERVRFDLFPSNNSSYHMWFKCSLWNFFSHLKFVFLYFFFIFLILVIMVFILIIVLLGSTQNTKYVTISYYY